MSGDLISVSDVQSKLREKVHAAFIELIPPETFDSFVAKSWQNLTEGRPPERDGYGREKPAQQPELVTMIETEMRKRLQEMVTAWGEEWRKGPEAEAAGKKIMTEIAKTASQSFIEATANSIVMAALQSLTLNGITTCSNCRRSATKNSNCANCGCWNS